jgi:hypothetical protein
LLPCHQHPGIQAGEVSRMITRHPISPVAMILPRTLWAILMGLCLVATAAAADVVEIPLPALLGEYPPGPGIVSRSVAFVLPRIPTVIHGVSFRVTGTSIPGVADCHGVGTADLWPMEFVAEMKYSPDDYWQALEEPSYSFGIFTRTAEFEPALETTTWEFLLDGEGEATLFGAPAVLAGCDPLVFPTSNIIEAVLIVDAEFTLAVESSTWGRIKALYR